MMNRCWAHDPGARPTFTYLSQWLKGLLSEGSALNHIDLTQSLGHGLYSVDEEDSRDDDIFLGSQLNEPPTPAVKLSQLMSSVNGGRPGETCGDSRADVSRSYTITLSDDSGYVGQQKVSVSSMESNVRASTVDSDSPTSLNSGTKARDSPGASYAEGYLDDVFLDEIPKEKLKGHSPPLSPLWSVDEEDTQDQPKAYASLSKSVSRVSSASSPKSIKLGGSANSLITRQRRHSESDLLSTLNRSPFSSSVKNNSKVYIRVKPKFSPSGTMKRDVTGLLSTQAIENKLYKLTEPRNIQKPPACVPVRKMARYGKSIMQSLAEAEAGGSTKKPEEKTSSESSFDSMRSLIVAADVYTFSEVKKADVAMPKDVTEGAGKFYTDLSVKTTSKHLDDKGRKQGADVLSMEAFSSRILSINMHDKTPKENEDNEELKRFLIKHGQADTSHRKQFDSPKDSFTFLSSSGEHQAEVYENESSKVTFMLHENHATGFCNYIDAKLTSPFDSGSLILCPWETNERAKVTRTPSLEDIGYSKRVMPPRRRRSSDPQVSLTSEASLQYSGSSYALLIGADSGSSQEGSSTALQNSATCFWWPTPRKRRMGTAEDNEPGQLQQFRQTYPNEKHPSALFLVSDQQQDKSRVPLLHLDV